MIKYRSGHRISFSLSLQGALGLSISNDFPSFPSCDCDFEALQPFCLFFVHGHVTEQTVTVKLVQYEADGRNVSVQVVGALRPLWRWKVHCVVFFFFGCLFFFALSRLSRDRLSSTSSTNWTTPKLLHPGRKLPGFPERRQSKVHCSSSCVAAFFKEEGRGGLCQQTNMSSLPQVHKALKAQLSLWSSQQFAGVNALPPPSALLVRYLLTQEGDSCRRFRWSVARHEMLQKRTHSLVPPAVLGQLCREL